MAAGVASIVFASGRLVLPVQSLYDRQALADHVLGYVRRGQEVRVRVDYTTWIVAPPAHPVICHGCTRRVDRAACQHLGKCATTYCVTCALARPRLTMPLLAQLPTTAILCDVQAQYAYGGELVAWTRWPQATPAEIMDDMRLQRRFAPVLTWACTEIRLPPNDPWQGQRRPPRSAKTMFERPGATSHVVGPRAHRSIRRSDLAGIG